MDKYVINKATKENKTFIGNQVIFDILVKIVDTCDTVCLYGDSGVGKTFTVHQVMNGRQWVDLTHEHIRNAEFMERLKDSVCHVVIDDLESDTHLVKGIFETVKSGSRVSRGSLIFISRTVTKIDFCNGIRFDHIDSPTMVTIGKRANPETTISQLEHISSTSKGNVRNFLYSIQFSEKRDIFKTPKDFIYDMLCPSDVDPLEYFGRAIPEHGYIWDIVHENYVDSVNADLEFIPECMSLADIIDTEIYKGNWCMIPFFSTVSTVMPAHVINHTLDRFKMRSGSAWTKFGNFKMRDMKFREMSKRTPHKLDVDSLMVIKSYCQKDPTKALELCKTYKLVSADIDIINHLAITHKMKTKEMQTIKKALKIVA